MNEKRRPARRLPNDHSAPSIHRAPERVTRKERAWIYSLDSPELEQLVAGWQPSTVRQPPDDEQGGQRER